MNEPNLTAQPKRSAWRRALLGMLAFSLIVNLTLAVKILVFDANYPFRPICHGGRHVGLVVLKEPMNKRFRDRMQLALWNSRLSRRRILYVSYWEWTNERTELWNATAAIAEYVYEQQKGIKPLTNQESEKLQTARCKFIRKYALRKPKS